MTSPGSVKRLIFQVMLLAAVFVGLSRLAGRTGAPVPSTGAHGSAEDTPASASGANEMSSVAPDLTFYRTLGKERSAPGGTTPGSKPRTTTTNDALGPRAPEPAAVPGGAFIVQALATRDAATAKRLRDRLAGRGFPATVIEDKSAGQPVYRVRVGRYATRAEAEAAVRVLRQKDRLNPWILQEGERDER